MDDKLTLDPAWYGRRQIVRISLGFCAGVLLLSMFMGAAMAAIVFPPITMGGFGIIGSYVFGAAWERVRGVPSGTKYEADGKTPLPWGEEPNEKG